MTNVHQWSVRHDLVLLLFGKCVTRNGMGTCEKNKRSTLWRLMEFATAGIRQRLFFFRESDSVLDRLCLSSNYFYNTKNDGRQMKENPSCCYYSMLCYLLCCHSEMNLLILMTICRATHIESPGHAALASCPLPVRLEMLPPVTCSPE